MEKFLKKIDSLPTLPIDLSKLVGKGEVAIQLKDLDPRLSTSDDELKLNFLVRPTKANLQLNNVKIRFLSSSQIRRASARTASLLVLSEKGENVDLKASQVSVIADIPEGKTGRVTVKLQAKLPEGIHLLKIQPENITVNLK